MNSSRGEGKHDAKGVLACTKRSVVYFFAFGGRQDIIFSIRLIKFSPRAGKAMRIPRYTRVRFDLHACHAALEEVYRVSILWLSRIKRHGFAGAAYEGSIIDTFSVANFFVHIILSDGTAGVPILYLYRSVSFHFFFQVIHVPVDIRTKLLYP